jgi:hypothetical protein
MKTKNNRKRKTDVAVAKLTEGDIQSFWESVLSGDDREFWEAEFARKAPTQEKRAFGSFLAELAAGRIPKATAPSSEEHAQIMQRVSDRIFLPTRLGRLKTELVGLKAEIAALRRAKSPKGKCPLWKYVRAAKEGNLSRVSDHGFIAKRVDALLEERKKELREVCPESWKKVHGLPRLLSDARKLPELKKPIKVFISKVTVS